MTSDEVFFVQSQNLTTLGKVSFCMRMLWSQSSFSLFFTSCYPFWLLTLHFMHIILSFGCLYAAYLSKESFIILYLTHWWFLSPNIGWNYRKGVVLSQAISYDHIFHQTIRVLYPGVGFSSASKCERLCNLQLYFSILWTKNLGKLA